MDRKNLVSVLTLASRALTKNDQIPIFKCFAFSGKTVMAYDGQIGIIGPCVTTETCCLNGALLLGWLSANKAPEVTLELQAQDAVLKGGRATCKLPHFPYEDFLFEEPEDVWDVTVDISGDFMLGLELCLETSSRDAAQPALLGICVTPGASVLYSSDGDAISEYKLADKVKGKEVFMLPNAFCSTLLAFFSEFEGIGGVLELNNKWARATLDGGYEIYGNMIENDNPVNFGAQIKKTMGAVDFFEVPAGLDDALARARVVADPESAKTELSIEKGRLRLVTTTSMGTVRDTLAFADHEDIVVHINASLMQRSLGHCNTISINENYCAFKSENLLIVTGNMD